jgi:putative DNA primase/helicase
VAQKYGLEFRRDGRHNLTAFCPFHKDKGKPNFKLDLRNGRFKCFACQWRGDIIDFVRAHTKESHRTTLEVLALQAGVDIGGFHSKILQFPKMPGLVTPGSAEPEPEDGVGNAGHTGETEPSQDQGAAAHSEEPADTAVGTGAGPGATSEPQSPEVVLPSCHGADPDGLGVPTTGPLDEFAKSDRNLAVRFSDFARPTLRFAGDKWMGWTGSYWNLRDVDNIELAIKKMFEFSDLMREEYRRESVPERKKIRKAIADTTSCSSKMRTIIDLSGTLLGIDNAQLDSNPRRLNVRNGTIDLQAGELLPHRSDDFITKISDVSYDVTAECPLWNRFLEAVQPSLDTRKYLQRAFGYAITGETTEHAMFYFFGNGANGKSTMVETIAALLRSADRVASSGYSLTVPPSVLTESATASGSSATPEVAQMRGARLVVSSEPDHRHRISPSVIKRLVGQDTISARHLYSQPVNFTPEFKLFLSANDKLMVPGTDEGIWRRIHLVPFNMSFPVNSSKRDKDLSAKFIPEFPGILRWMVLGSMEWFLRELGTCPEVQAATDGYRSEMDYMGQFIQEHCEVDLGDSSTTAQASLLLSVFNDWLRDSQSMMRPWTAGAVRAALVKRGIVPYRLGAKGPMYRHIRLVASPESHYSRSVRP